MKAFALGALSSALLLTGSLVHAQTANPAISGSITVTFDGEPYNSAPLYVNKKDCDDNVPVKFSISGLPTTNVMVIETWLGQGQTDCNAQSGRQLPTNSSGGKVPCELIDRTTSVMSAPTFTYRVAKALDCSTGANQTLYFVPLPGETPKDATTSNTPASQASKPYSVTFQVDISPPAALTGVDPSDGEHEVGANWNISDDSNAKKYNVYFDMSAVSESGTPCSSELLVPGKLAPDDPDIYVKTAEGTDGHADPENLGMDIGQQIPVAVAVEDRAGNPSKLSKVVCASRIETEGFWERYQAEGGDGLDECSARPFAASHGAAAWLLLGLGGLLLWRRKPE